MKIESAKININTNFLNEIGKFNNELKNLVDPNNKELQLALFNSKIEQSIAYYSSYLLKDYIAKYISNEDVEYYTLPALITINSEFKFKEDISAFLVDFLKTELSKYIQFNSTNTIIIETFLKDTFISSDTLQFSYKVLGTDMNLILGGIVTTTRAIISEHFNKPSFITSISPMKLLENPESIIQLEKFISIAIDLDEKKRMHYTFSDQLNNTK